MNPLIKQLYNITGVYIKNKPVIKLINIIYLQDMIL